MSYKVIHAFTDTQDFNHIYRVGDVYPRSGTRVSEKRVKELASNKNKQKKALIAPDKDVFSDYMNPPEEYELPFVTVPDKQYTKTDINRMSTADLRKMASNTGVENADTMTGAELKKYLINVFGL